MGKCIFEDVCDKSWCRLYSFECVDGQIYTPKTSNEQSKKDALNVINRDVLIGI